MRPLLHQAVLVVLLLCSTGRPAIAQTPAETPGPTPTASPSATPDATPTIAASPTPLPTATPDPLCGSTLTSSVLKLERDVAGCTRFGVRLRGTASLDCDGHTIGGAGGTYGILLDGASGAEVRNCGATGFGRGIRVSGGSGNLVTGNHLFANQSYGIELAGASTGNRIEANTVEDSGDEGIHVGAGANGNTISGNTVRRSAVENLYLIGCTDNVASDNVLEGSGNAAIFVKHATGNRFARNTVRNGMVQIRGAASANEFTDNVLEDYGYQIEAYQEADGAWSYPHDNVVTGGSIREADVCFTFLGAYDNHASGVSILRCTPVLALALGGREATGNTTDLCGDGVVSGTEQCDAGNANGTATACCSAACTPTSGNVCRAALSECDRAETCDGISGTCPANGYVTSGTACTPDAKLCTSDVCDGAGRCAHPPGNAGALCRAASGPCDVAETCSGTATACPTNRFAAAGTTCRAASGTCDLAETCSGTSGSCPVDGYAAAGTTCRTAAGACDVAETCTGASASCPQDGFASAGTACRAAADVCDLAEACTGSSAACPQDRFKSAGTLCRAAAGSCDRAETCSGASSACRPDAFARDGASCNDGNPCTTADKCSAGQCAGSALACPAPSNPCQQEGVCDPASGSCSYAPVACDACEVCDQGSGCVTRPRSDCADAAPGGSRIVLLDRRNDGRDSLTWRWSSAVGTDRAAFGDPTGADDYGLCLFSTSAAGSSLVLRMSALGGGTCGAGPCWTATDTGFRYDDPTALPDGVTRVELGTSVDGVGSLLVTGRGTTMATPRLPLATPLLVQLQSPTGACWQARFATLATNKRNKARGPSD